MNICMAKKIDLFGGRKRGDEKHVVAPFSVFFQLQLEASQRVTNSDRQAKANF